MDWIWKERWVNIFVKIGREGTSVLAVSENIPPESLLIFG